MTRLAEERRKAERRKHIHAFDRGDRREWCACGYNVQMPYQGRRSGADRRSPVAQAKCPKCLGSKLITTDGFGGSNFVKCGYCDGTGIDASPVSAEKDAEIERLTNAFRSQIEQLGKNVAHEHGKYRAAESEIATLKAKIAEFTKEKAQ